MQTVIVAAATGCPFAEGVTLGLTPAQAAERKVEPVKGRRNVYRLLAPTQFKRGEILGIEGDVPKALVDLVDTAEDIAARAEAEKAAADAAEAAIQERIAAALAEQAESAEAAIEERIAAAVAEQAESAEAAIEERIAAAVAAERARLLALSADDLAAARSAQA